MTRAPARRVDQQLALRLAKKPVRGLAAAVEVASQELVALAQVQGR